MGFAFHRQVFLPEWLDRPRGVTRLEYSRHALEEAEFDPAINLTGYLPTEFDFRPESLIEVTTDAKLRFEKGLYRVPANQKFDLCLVLCRPEAGKARVASVWANASRDHHSTLRKERYVPPPIQV